MRNHIGARLCAIEWFDNVAQVHVCLGVVRPRIAKRNAAGRSGELLSQGKREAKHTCEVNEQVKRCAVVAYQRGCLVENLPPGGAELRGGGGPEVEPCGVIGGYALGAKQRLECRPVDRRAVVLTEARSGRTPHSRWQER